MAAKPVGAVVITEDPVLIYNAEAGAKLAQEVPARLDDLIEFAQAVGFAGYGVDYLDMWRYAATFVDSIFGGRKNC